MNKLTRTEWEEVQLAVMNDKEFTYIENLCEQYLIKYNEKLIDQLLDKYSYAINHLEGVSKDQAKELVLKNFTINVKEQYSKRFH
jgi:hypothetical protein